MGNELYVVVGLGNPGPKYENTRHNLGFLTVDKIAEDNNITVKKLKFKGRVILLPFSFSDFFLLPVFLLFFYF